MSRPPSPDSHNSPSDNPGTLHSMPMAKELTTLQADVAEWPVPSVATLRGTGLGAADVSWYFPAPMTIRDGKPTPDDQQSAVRMEEQFDALLYVGRPSAITMSRITPERCSDANFMTLRLSRLALLPGPLAQIQIGRLKQDCGATSK